MSTSRRTPHVRLGAALAISLTLLLPGVAAGGNRDTATLMRYADSTWASFVAMTDPASGLPADSLSSDGTTSIQTSTTNIGAYMWSTLVADELGIIRHRESVSRLRTTLDSLDTM
jgi:hypothetical protein